ncbi:MAG: SHOCT domain-containing protein, partial [Candidatus Methylomirabilales bacterium]
MILGGFFSLVFWVGLIAFGVWAVRRLTERPRPNDALRILQERFARGEIDVEEYERRRRVLGS